MAGGASTEVYAHGRRAEGLVKMAPGFTYSKVDNKIRVSMETGGFDSAR